MFLSTDYTRLAGIAGRSRTEIPTQVSGTGGLARMLTDKGHYRIKGINSKSYKYHNTQVRSRFLGGHFPSLLSRLLQIVIPECFYRESLPDRIRFPLKLVPECFYRVTCRNDRLWMCFPDTATACLSKGEVMPFV